MQRMVVVGLHVMIDLLGYIRLPGESEWDWILLLRGMSYIQAFVFGSSSLTIPTPVLRRAMEGAYSVYNIDGED